MCLDVSYAFMLMCLFFVDVWKRHVVSAIQFSHHDKGIYPSSSHVVKMNVHIVCIKRTESQHQLFLMRSQINKRTHVN